MCRNIMSTSKKNDHLYLLKVVTFCLSPLDFVKAKYCEKKRDKMPATGMYV